MDQWVVESVLLILDDVFSSWKSWDSLGGDGALACLLGFSFLLVILLDTFNEGFTDIRLSDVLNADVNSLWNDSVADEFIHDDTD